MQIDPKIFELLIETVRDYAVFVLDPQGNVATWNAGARLLKGYQPEEIIGKHFSTFYTEEAKKMQWPEYELRMATLDGRFEDEGWRVRKDGSRFWANVIITAMRDEHGTLLGFSKITRDLSARRQAEEQLRQSEERFRLLVEGVVDYAVYMLDPTGLITSWNTGAQRIQGYTREEIVGKHVSHFYTADDVKAGLPWQELVRLRSQGHLETEGFRVRQDGARFLARVVLSSLYDFDGRLQGFAVVTQDLTARQHAQTLERTTQHVTEFIAVLAHELRNPLAPIRHAVAVLESTAGNTAAQTRMYQVIGRQSGYLAKIVDDLLDINRITRGTLTLQREPTDLVEVVRAATETVLPAVEAAGLSLETRLPECSLCLNGDVGRLTQLVTNLLTNAVRFTPRGGRITVSADRLDGYLQITVRDTGRGIAAEDLLSIFGMFVQGKAAINRVGGGLGVGLALSRRIAELHGGTIEAHSRGAGQGSEFTLRLPILGAITYSDASKSGAGKSGADKPVPRPTAVAPLPSRRVLVVDDNHDAANTLNSLLQSLGHSTRVAFDGPTALQIAEQFQPDLVLLDIGMPGMSGYDVARRLRSRTGTHPKIVAVTGWGADEDRARSQEAGFDRHLVKPVDESALRQALTLASVTTH